MEKIKKNNKNNKKINLGSQNSNEYSTFMRKYN